MTGMDSQNLKRILRAVGNCRGWVLLFMIWGCAVLPTMAQNSDNAYRQTLQETLDRIEEIFEVDLRYSDELVKDKSLDYAFWRIRPGNLENSLTHVLAPFDLTFFKESDAVFTIKKFEYPRRSVSIGEEHLEFLSGLYNDENEWETRKSVLQSCLRKSLGLDNLPEAPKSKPIISSKRKYKGYTVENVALEIFPGVFTTGSVYKPRPLKKDHPIILTPNGHFGQGRYRESQQIRCATLARMGAVVVSYDLFAWGESLLQFDSKDHRASIAHTIQAWNGIQWMNYLASLPETNPDKIGITGGSGGGSQTMLLTAIDERIKVSVPVVMVASHFSGGCPCESGTPIHLCGKGTNNAEIAAMAAPRPMLIISDGGDWTRTVPELEFPYIQKIYGFYKNPAKVENVHFPEEGHDYGASKRQAMYPFMAKYLGLKTEKVRGENGEIEEKRIPIESENQLKVFGKNGERLPEHAVKGLEELYSVLGQKP